MEADKEYLVGITIKDTLKMLVRTCNQFESTIDFMKKRILELEIQIRCDHQFMEKDEMLHCIHCKLKKKNKFPLAYD